MEREYITPKELAQMLPITENTLAKHRWLKIGIPYIKLGRHVMYKISDIRDYMEQNKIETQG